nr:hypothetical protein Q903MT_gene1987 [Picea sitchensis]
MKHEYLPIGRIHHKGNLSTTTWYYRKGSLLHIAIPYLSRLIYLVRHLYCCFLAERIFITIITH